MAKKYQPTELDRVLQQSKEVFPKSEEPNHYEMANEFLMRDIEVLKKKIQELEKREETHKHIVPNLQAWRDRHADTIKEYDKLKSECHKDIEKVWMYDSSYGLDDNQTIDRDGCIERVFYKIANEWIGGDNRAELQKRTDPQRWESLDDMDGSWTEDDIEKGNHLPF
jgi:hypothetical protein